MSRRAAWFDGADTQGFVSVRHLMEDDLAWNDLSIRAKRAATGAGFSRDHAWQLMAAMEEIYSNVVEHSGRADTGYVAFAARKGTFEFVVGDRGIGVLASLRKNPAYADLADSGTALEFALSEGVSSKIEAGRGFGFRPIFVGLANISNHLRFRSGDYAHEMKRETASEIPAHTLQSPAFEGFFCAVQCSVT